MWRWIALAGRTRAGAVIGINLVDPTPDAEDPAISENCAWLDGARVPLTDVAIAVTTPGDPTSAWTARAGHARLAVSSAASTATAVLELAATPIAHVEQRLDVPVVRHRLLHVVSELSGTLRTADGTAHVIDRVCGIAEDNDTWW